MLLKQVKRCSRSALATPSRSIKAGPLAFGCCCCSASMSATPRRWAAAQRCQNTHTWHLQVALTFSPASAGPATIRHEISVSGSPTSGHNWAQHQVPAPSPAPSPAAPIGPVCPYATPTWSKRKPPVSSQQRRADQERENTCYLYARETADFNNRKDKIETRLKKFLRERMIAEGSPTHKTTAGI